MQNELSYVLSSEVEPKSHYLRARVKCVVLVYVSTKENNGFIQVHTQLFLWGGCALSLSAP